MDPEIASKPSLQHAYRAEKLSTFGLTVMATVVGCLVVSGILWCIGALNQVDDLTAKVDSIEKSMSQGFDELKDRMAALSDDTTLRNIADDLDKLQHDFEGSLAAEKNWRGNVELRLTVLENPVGGDPKNDRIKSSNHDHYLPELKRGSKE